MSSDSGITIATVATASTRHASRQPTASISTVVSGVSTTPAKETPIAATPITRPRFSTNHFASVTLTTRLPIIAAPAVSARPLSSHHCHSSRTVEQPSSAAPSSSEPTCIRRRPPCRSTWPPT